MLLVSLAAVLVAVMAVAGQQAVVPRKAHSTFENYYAFRGCAQLVERTSDYGVCRLASGKAVKIVRFRGRWYLDGDLPVCVGGLCL